MNDHPTPDHIEPAELSWNARGEPRSTRFDDKYFSADDGLEEVRYLFIGNNGLPERWRERRRFVICETGFGTGLNWTVSRRPAIRRCGARGCFANWPG